MLGKIAEELIRVANPRLTLNHGSAQHNFEVTDFENADGKITFGISIIFVENEDVLPLLRVEFKEDGESKDKLGGVGASDIFKTEKVLLDLCAIALERSDASDLFAPVAPTVTIEKGCEACCKLLCTGWTPPPAAAQAPIGQITNLGGVA